MNDISCDSGNALYTLLDDIFNISSCSSITAIKPPSAEHPNADDLSVVLTMQSADQDTLRGLGLNFKKVADNKVRLLFALESTLTDLCAIDRSRLTLM